MILYTIFLTSPESSHQKVKVNISPITFSRILKGLEVIDNPLEKAISLKMLQKIEWEFNFREGLINIRLEKKSLIPFTSFTDYPNYASGDTNQVCNEIIIYGE